MLRLFYQFGMHEKTCTEWGMKATAIETADAGRFGKGPRSGLVAEYWSNYRVNNFVYFCDPSLFLILLRLWTEKALPHWMLKKSREPAAIC